MTIRSLIATAVVLILASASPALGEDDFGYFIGKFVAEFGGDGRKVTLREPFGFMDPAGREWNVPDGYRTDGASVPSLLWALYPPFTGHYRSAAVIHDYYCDSKQRSWQDTHKVFYFAMRAAEVKEKTAKILYGAVYMFGPRWGPETRAGQRSAPIEATAEQQAELVKKLKDLVERDNPDLDSLEAEAQRMGAEAARLP